MTYLPLTDANFPQNTYLKFLLQEIFFFIQLETTEKIKVWHCFFIFNITLSQKFHEICSIDQFHLKNHTISDVEEEEKNKNKIKIWTQSGRKSICYQNNSINESKRAKKILKDLAGVV